MYKSRIFLHFYLIQSHKKLGSDFYEWARRELPEVLLYAQFFFRQARSLTEKLKISSRASTHNNKTAAILLLRLTAIDSQETIIGNFLLS
jgi:hypothetical protein